jgi:hypothetical protein
VVVAVRPAGCYILAIAIAPDRRTDRHVIIQKCKIDLAHIYFYDLQWIANCLAQGGGEKMVGICFRFCGWFQICNNDRITDWLGKERAL